MHSFCIAVAVLSGTTSFALLMAGFISLGAPDQSERVLLRERFAAAREKGSFSEYREMMRVRYEWSDPVHIIRRWPNRREARGLIYAGLVCAAVALVVGLLAGRFPDSTPRPNQAMQPTAGRCTASLYFMKTRPLQATLALASGR